MRGMTVPAPQEKTMNQRSRLTAGALGLLMVAALPACARRSPGADHDLAAMIEQARTAADHEALAAAYQQRAADAEREAERHRKMEKTYAVGASTGRVGLTPLPQHCRAIARRWADIAREYAALAAAQRELAAAAR
jgi:hypothetical protein